MYELTAWKSTEIGQNQIQWTTYSPKCAITDFYDVYLFFYWLLTLLTEVLSPL